MAWDDVGYSPQDTETPSRLLKRAPEDLHDKEQGCPIRWYSTLSILLHVVHRRFQPAQVHEEYLVCHLMLITPLWSHDNIGKVQRAPRGSLYLRPILTTVRFSQKLLMIMSRVSLSRSMIWIHEQLGVLDIPGYPKWYSLATIAFADLIGYTVDTPSIFSIIERRKKPQKGELVHSCCMHSRCWLVVCIDERMSIIRSDAKLGPAVWK